VRPARGAFNDYLRALRVWDRCIQNTYCDMDTDAQPKMREQWSSATDHLEEAEQGLEEMAARPSHHVERVIELTVAAAVEAVAFGGARRCLERRGSRQHREGPLRSDP
jgi:hypothetical protein